MEGHGWLGSELTKPIKDNKLSVKAGSKAKILDILMENWMLNFSFIIPVSSLSYLDSKPYLKGILPANDCTNQEVQ
jgi:hypothetical protein